MLPGKASKRVACAPVPKPTQVGEWRTLRRSSELWLRNSANCPRNFGRRGALSGQVPRGPVREGPDRSELPFSRSYGDNLPSSLTIVHSIALVFSTRPPVSVLVRARTQLA